MKTFNNIEHLLELGAFISVMCLVLSKWMQKWEVKKAGSIPISTRVKYRMLKLGTAMRPFHGWKVFSRRGVLHIDNDMLSLSKMKIPISRISKANLYTASAPPYAKWAVLRVATEKHIIDLWLNPYLAPRLDFPFKYEEIREVLVSKRYKSILVAIFLSFAAILLAALYYVEKTY